MRKKMMICIVMVFFCFAGQVMADHRVDILTDTVNSSKQIISLGIENSDTVWGVVNSFWISATGDLTADFSNNYPPGVPLVNPDGHCDVNMGYHIILTIEHRLLFGGASIPNHETLPPGDMSIPCFFFVIEVDGSQGDVCIDRGSDMNWIWTALDGITNLDPLFNNGEGPHCMPFILKCGDTNADGSANVSDAVYLLNYIFLGGDSPVQSGTADVNCDGLINVSDVVYIKNSVFTGGPPPCDNDNDGVPDC